MFHFEWKIFKMCKIWINVSFKMKNNSETNMTAFTVNIRCLFKTFIYEVNTIYSWTIRTMCYIKVWKNIIAICSLVLWRGFLIRCATLVLLYHVAVREWYKNSCHLQRKNSCYDSRYSRPLRSTKPEKKAQISAQKKARIPYKLSRLLRHRLRWD